jgi:uncharacterized integral membrane protein
MAASDQSLVQSPAHGVAPAPPLAFVADGSTEVRSVASAPPPALSRTRIAFAWWTLGFSVVLLIVVLIFAVQNLSPAKTKFFGAVWTIPLGLDLLLAALVGTGIAFLLGAARIFQLRRGARRLDSRRDVH